MVGDWIDWDICVEVSCNMANRWDYFSSPFGVFGVFFSFPFSTFPTHLSPPYLIPSGSTLCSYQCCCVSISPPMSYSRRHINLPIHFPCWVKKWTFHFLLIRITLPHPPLSEYIVTSTSPTTLLYRFNSVIISFTPCTTPFRTKFEFHLELTFFPKSPLFVLFFPSPFPPLFLPFPLCIPSLSCNMPVGCSSYVIALIWLHRCGDGVDWAGHWGCLGDGVVFELE